MFVSGGTGSVTSCWASWRPRAVMVGKCTMTWLYNLALSLTFWIGLENKPALCPAHSCSVVSWWGVEVLWCAKIRAAREGNASMLEAQALERRAKRVSRNSSSTYSSCFGGSGTRALITWPTDLQVRFWQAGFDFRGVLDTLQKAVYLAIPARSLLTVISYWNIKIKHCYSDWLTCTPGCMHLLHYYYSEITIRIWWLYWASPRRHDSWQKIMFTLWAILQIGLWSVVQVYYWESGKFLFVCSCACGAFLMS